MAEKLKEDSKRQKKQKEVLVELSKLQGQDLRVLQSEVGTLNTELE